MLKVARLVPEASLPSKGSPGAAGYDLASVEQVTILPWRMALIKTGLAIQVPPGTYGRVAPRSGLSLRGCHIGAGVIDEDYRGQVGVVMYNLSNTPLQIGVGDRIAQLVLEKIASVEVEEGALEETSRGEGGFGSTGA